VGTRRNALRGGSFQGNSYGRFPPPWSIGDVGAAFVVKDGGGQKLAYVYYKEEPGPRSAAKPLSKNGARRIAANVAKLPELVKNKCPAERQIG
jgi:hypothetical protein